MKKGMQNIDQQNTTLASAGPTGTETFKEAYCRKFACPPEQYERKVFWDVVYPQARLFILLGRYRSAYFAPDRGLVTYCGMLRALREIDAELREYANLRENRGFLRETLCIRVSGRRLRRLAASCLDS